MPSSIVLTASILVIAYTIFRVAIDLRRRKSWHGEGEFAVSIESPGKLILLVEDDEDDAFLLTRALRAAEIDNPIQVIRDGEEALNYLKGAGKYSDRTEHPLPGLILLDLKLPRLSGLEVLQRIQNETSLPPLVIVVLSSSGETRDINMAYRFGAHSYLMKPCSAADLVDLAKGLKLYWLQLNQGGEKRELRVIPDDITSVDTLISKFSQSAKQESASHPK